MRWGSLFKQREFIYLFGCGISCSILDSEVAVFYHWMVMSTLLSMHVYQKVTETEIDTFNYRSSTIEWLLISTPVDGSI